MIETVNESVVEIEPKIVLAGEEIIVLPVDTDFNTLTNNGIYQIDYNIITVKVAENSSGSDVVNQIKTADDGTVKYRQYQGIIWSDWKEVAWWDYTLEELALKVDKEDGKELALPPAYASIYVADGNTAQTIPTGANYTKVTAYTTNGLNSNCTPDAANDKITITAPGIYDVDYTASYTADVNDVTFRGVVFLGGVEQPNIHSGGQMGLQGAMRSTACNGTINVTTVPVDIDVRIRHDNGGNVAIIHVYANLNIKRIG